MAVNQASLVRPTLIRPGTWGLVTFCLILTTGVPTTLSGRPQAGTEGWISTAEVGKRIGLNGLDTSHAPAFARTFNARGASSEDLLGFRIVAAYPQGSRDIECSVSRVPEYVQEMRAMGVETVDSIPALLGKVDFYPLLSGVIHVPFPDPYRPLLSLQPGEDYGEVVINYLEHQIFEKLVPANDVAAIIVEPIQGEGVYIMPTPGFFPALRKICDRDGILLISDEVMRGWGRTGKWFAVDHWDVVPDMITTAKGLTSGYVPLGAVIVSEKIGDYFEDRMLWCGLT